VLTSNAIVRNHFLGVFAYESGTVVEGDGNLIEATLPQESDQLFGMGLGVDAGARATLSNSAIVGNRAAGVLVLDADSQVSATSVLIEGTVADAAGEYGVGVACLAGATLTLTSSVVADNHVAAVMVTGAEALVSGSWIFGVPDGRFASTETSQTFEGVGDGVLALHGATVTVADSRIQGCLRAGLLFHDSGGSVSGTTSTENGYGLFLSGSAAPTLADDNVLVSNGEDGPVTGELPIPDAP